MFNHFIIPVQVLMVCVPLRMQAAKFFLRIFPWSSFQRFDKSFVGHCFCQYVFDVKLFLCEYCLNTPTFVLDNSHIVWVLKWPPRSKLRFYLLVVLKIKIKSIKTFTALSIHVLHVYKIFNELVFCLIEFSCLTQTFTPLGASQPIETACSES